MLEGSARFHAADGLAPRVSVCESVGIDSAGAYVVFDGVRRNVRCVFISVSTRWVYRREGGRGDWVRSAAVRGDECVGAQKSHISSPIQESKMVWI